MASTEGFTGNVSRGPKADKARRMPTSVVFEDADAHRKVKTAAAILGLGMGEFLVMAGIARANEEFAARGIDPNSILQRAA